MLNYSHQVTHRLHLTTVPTALGFVLFQQLWETWNTFLLGFLQHTCSATVYPHVMGQAFLVRLQTGQALDIKVVEKRHGSIPNTLPSHGLLWVIHTNKDFPAPCFSFEDFLLVKCSVHYITLWQASWCYKNPSASGKREHNFKSSFNVHHDFIFICENNYN